MAKKGSLNARFLCLQAIIVMMSCVGNSFITPILQRFGYEPFDIGVTMTCAAITAAVAKPLWGYVNDRFACAKQLVLAGTALGCAAYGLLIASGGQRVLATLAVMLLTQAKLQRLFIPVVALQTIAANLGSSFTPLGNPQNLYLYSLTGMHALAFLKVMALPTIAAFALLCVSLLFIRSDPLAVPADTGQQHVRKRRIFPWVLLFFLCLLTVLRLLPYGLVMVIVIAGVILLDHTILWDADYGLLLTFLFFFIFIGNLKNIPAVSAALSALVVGRELPAGVLLSQIISNVPAAMLLSGFSQNYVALLYGVNLGGLGTLIASMASMISYKVYSVTDQAQIGKYLAIFTGLNVAFLALLYAVVALFL